MAAICNYKSVTVEQSEQHVTPLLVVLATSALEKSVRCVTDTLSNFNLLSPPAAALSRPPPQRLQPCAHCRVVPPAPARAAKVAPKLALYQNLYPKLQALFTASLAGTSPVLGLSKSHGVFNSIGSVYPVTPPVQDPSETKSSAATRPDHPATAPEEETNDTDTKIAPSTSPLTANKTKPETT